MWSLYTNGKFLKPLIFSNNKSQEDIVNEVIQANNQGHRIIFIKGMCGTGKSSIALNISKELGRASVVVPIKTLQKQYEDDYTNKKYIIKNNKKLRIQVLTGRNNHLCPFINLKKQENEINNPRTTEQTKLFDFESDNNIDSHKNKENNTCDNPYIPCKIEIKEKNLKKIKNFIRLNPNVKTKDFDTIWSVRRMSIAPVCPYWSPIISLNIDVNLPDSDPIKYLGLCNINYLIHRRKHGCGYYDQFQAYADADVIVFNSQKYKIETAMNRKPKTDVEIIDECDEFLDSLSNQKTLNLNRLQLALSNLSFYDDETLKLADEIIKVLNSIIKKPETKKLIKSEEIIQLRDSEILAILKYFLNSPNLTETFGDDELNYCNACYEIALLFKDFFDETYISFYEEERESGGKIEKDIIVKLVTVNLEKRLKEFIDKNKVLVFMSGTIHSDDVLRKVFGISDFKTIEAESKTPGKVTKIKTGLEENFRYNNIKQGKVTREQYLGALSKCIEKAIQPVLVHVNSFSDLPSEQEKQKYNVKNLMTMEELKKQQKKYKMAELINDFKQGKTKILFSTKCKRGMDFPGNTCNTIVLTKYPYPDTSSLFWRVLKKTHPDLFWEFYKDKANREFHQKIYRGLRSENDHIYLLSPDTKVLSEDV